MKSIARLCWTFGTALPIQRWVGWLALAVWAFVLLVRALSGPPLWVLGIIATAMYLLATTFASGYLFRQWSAPRTHRFLPHFRALTLTAFMIVVAVISAPGLALLALPWQPATFTAGVTQLLIFNLVALLTFSPSAGIVVGLLFLAFLAIATRLLTGATPVGLFPGAPAAIGVAVWAAVWTAVALWYLRVRAIGRVQWPPPALLGSRLDWSVYADTTGEFSRRSALATSFTVRYPLRATSLLIWFAIGLVSFANVMAISRRFGAPAAGFLLFGLSTTTFVIAPVANQVARRSRSLWLTSGLSRRALFGATERQVWSRSLPAALVLFGAVVVVAAFVFDPPADLIGRVCAVWAASALLGAYLGLAEVRGLHALEIGVGVAFYASVTIGIWAALGAPRYDWLVGVTVAQLAAAAAVRALAIARWRRLDWLTFRPLRVPSQSVRASG